MIYKITMDKANPDTLQFDRDNLTENLICRLNKEQKNELKAFAEKHKTTSSQVVRAFINNLTK